MEANRIYFTQDIVPQWDNEQDLLLNMQQIIRKLVKAETVYVKALMDTQKLRLKDNRFQQNQGLLSLQITLINFITSLATQHSEIIMSINEDILPDLTENQSIQKTYRSHYSTVVNDKKQKEIGSISHYITTLDRYNSTVEALDDNAEEGQEIITEKYEECKNEWQQLQEQRDVYQATFVTICDNFCRIRYNNLSIAASCVRKLFVYLSSATANTQFDIQAISQKISNIPSSQAYQMFKDGIVLPIVANSDIFTLIPSESVTVQDKNTVETPIMSKAVLHHCLSEESAIAQIPLHDEMMTQTAHSDEPTDNHETPLELLSLSISLRHLLNDSSIHHQDKNPTIIRQVSSLFINHNDDEVSRIKSNLIKYISSEPMGALHTAHAMISTLMFSNVEKLRSPNREACCSIISRINAVERHVPVQAIQLLNDSFLISKVRFCVCRKQPITTNLS